MSSELQAMVQAGIARLETPVLVTSIRRTGLTSNTPVQDTVNFAVGTDIRPILIRTVTSVANFNTPNDRSAYVSLENGDRLGAFATATTLNASELVRTMYDESVDLTTSGEVSTGKPQVVEFGIVLAPRVNVHTVVLDSVGAAAAEFKADLYYVMARLSGDALQSVLQQFLTVS